MQQCQLPFTSASFHSHRGARHLQPRRMITAERHAGVLHNINQPKGGLSSAGKNSFRSYLGKNLF